MVTRSGHEVQIASFNEPKNKSVHKRNFADNFVCVWDIVCHTEETTEKNREQAAKKIPGTKKEEVKETRGGGQDND